VHWFTICNPLFYRRVHNLGFLDENRVDNFDRDRGTLAIYTY